jgi:predicted RNase H-like nuclease (RuvC/YqgF family)
MKQEAYQRRRIQELKQEVNDLRAEVERLRARNKELGGVHKVFMAKEEQIRALRAKLAEAEEWLKAIARRPELSLVARSMAGDGVRAIREEKDA